ncbi:hypothetical protein [Halomonas elongata]|nr:hypothetical protein [Halomonas elongata]WBF17660.1 hypothetical protein LM502_16525 [Halomonas elongata]WPU46499.1 hypothetical protein SR933_14755 [Halomonas elongata DSM 2581]
MDQPMKKAIVALAIMLFVMACLTVVTALALDEPDRVVWLYGTSELFLLSGAVILGWCVKGDSILPSTKSYQVAKWGSRHLGPGIIGLILVNVSGWIHTKTRMQAAAESLSGLEGAFAEASFHVLTLFHIVVAVAIVFFLLRLTVRTKLTSPP